MSLCYVEKFELIPSSNFQVLPFQEIFEKWLQKHPQFLSYYHALCKIVIYDYKIWINESEVINEDIDSNRDEHQD